MCLFSLRKLFCDFHYSTKLYRENITRLLPLALLLVLRTRNNTDGNKLVIFSGIAWYYGDNYKVTKKFAKRKQAHVGMKSSKTNQTRRERHHNTFTPSLHLVPFCQNCVFVFVF